MRFIKRSWRIVFLLMVLATGVLLISCETSKQTADILTKEELSALMIEIYLAEARLNMYSISKDSLAKLYMPFEDSLLKQSGISEHKLRETYQYYFDHPEELERVYDIVIDSLNLREQKAAAREGVVK